MKTSLAIALAGLMFLAVLVLRRFHSDTATGFALVAMFLMWFLLVAPVRMKWGDAGMEQWRAIRQKGRARFVLLQGAWWMSFFLLLHPSLDFAAGSEIKFLNPWLVVLIAILIWPVEFGEWNSRERKFLEWEKRGPLPENGVV